MKFPKLKHTFWCSLIYLFPTIIMLVAIITAAVLAENEKISDELFAIILISLVLLNLFWLINGTGTVLYIDIISGQRKIRRWYYCPKNGADADAIKSKIQKRLERFGEEKEPLQSHLAPAVIKQRTDLSRRYYQNYRYTYIALVYETDLLTMDVYNDIMRSASANSKALSNTASKSKGDPSSPLDTHHTAIILADYIADDMVDAVYNDKSGNTKPLVCIAELNTGRYFVNTVSARNGSLSLVKKLVFGGTISYKGNDNTMPMPEYVEELAETSFWKSLKENGGLFGSYAAKKKRRVLDNLKSGEVMIYDEDIYVRIGQRIACFITDVEDNDPNTLIIFVEKEPFWDKPFGETIPKRDVGEIIKRVEKFMNEQGTRYRFVDPDEEE